MNTQAGIHSHSNSQIKKIYLLGFLTLGSLYLGTQVHAAENQPWLVRARAVQIDTANKSDPVPALGIAQSDTIHVSNELIPEVDISYFFTPNWAAELVLTYPQKHEVSVELNGTSTPLGTFKHLPPTLSLQYHFQPKERIQPYLGVGVNYTSISAVNLAAGAQKLDLDNSSLGLALGAGVDFKIQDNLYLNLDVKKVQIRSDVLANGQKVSEVRVDPTLWGVGLGWRF